MFIDKMQDKVRDQAPLWYERREGTALPRTGLLFYAKLRYIPGIEWEPGVEWEEGVEWAGPPRYEWVDSIGLSISDYALVDPTLQSLFYANANTLRDMETIVSNIKASAHLNNGTELIGTELKGYALYADGTDASVLSKAIKYFGL